MADIRFEELCARFPVRAEPNAKSVAFDLQVGPLTDNGATQWVASVGLGTPPQPLLFMCDSGTENSWITSAACETEACLAHQRFDPNESSTYQLIDGTEQKVSFGPWGDMYVIIGKDVFTLKQIFPDSQGSVTLEEPLKIQLATNYSGPKFQGLACDGGLAIPSIPVSNEPSQPAELLPQLIKENLIDMAIVSFWLDPQSQQGECMFGAVDSTKFDPTTLNAMELIFVGDGLNYLWTVTLDEFNVGGQTVCQQQQFALDSGSSWFKGSEAMINPLIDAITKQGTLPEKLQDPAEFANYPDISVVLNGRPYNFTPAQYFLRIPSDGDTWMLGFHVLPGLPDNLLLVGSLFMETVYSIFVYGNGTRNGQFLVLASPV